MADYDDLIPKKGGIDYSDLMPKEDRAAFGVYPKQRATPSKPETKAAVQKASGIAADILGLRGAEEPEFVPERVPAAAGITGAAMGAAPYALKGAGTVVGAIPTPYTKAAGAGLRALGVGMEKLPFLRRAASGAVAGGGAELGGQVAEQLGAPPIVGQVAGGYVAPAATRGVTKALVGEPTVASERLARTAENLGFKLSPSQVRGDVPVPSRGASFNQEANQELANKLSSAGTGKETRQITDTFIKGRLKDLGKQYDDLYKGKQFRADASIQQDLNNILMREQELGFAGVTPVKQAAQTILETIDAKGLVLNGSDLQRLRNALTERARSSSSRGSAHEIYEIVDKIDDSISKLNPAYKATLDELRPKYRNTIILEDLYRQGGIKQGNISLEQLGTMLRGKRDAVRRNAMDIDSLGELGRELQLRARWETEGKASIAGQDILGQALGTGADIASTLTGLRSAPARQVQKGLLTTPAAVPGTVPTAVGGARAADVLTPREE
jgi:hypothetical protein